jgi:hypothetical protein
MQQAIKLEEDLPGSLFLKDSSDLASSVESSHDGRAKRTRREKLLEWKHNASSLLYPKEPRREMKE